GDRAAGLDILSDFPDGPLDHHIPNQATLAQLETLDDGQTRAVEDRQVMAKPGEGQHVVELAEDRQFQLKPVVGQGEGRPITAQERHANEDQYQRGQPDKPRPLDDAAQGENDPRQQRLLDMQTVQQSGEFGDDVREQEQNEYDDNGDDNGRINRGL